MEDYWIVDSGCTEYITYLAEWLENLKASTCEPSIMIPNGDSIPVMGKGSCRLPNGREIKAVLHFLKFKCNLLSVSRLTKDHQCAVIFLPEFCFMQDLRSRKIIGMGKCERGLYQMKMMETKRKAMMASGDVWHKRIGHTSSSKLSHFYLSRMLPLKLLIVIHVLRPITPDCLFR